MPGARRAKGRKSNKPRDGFIALSAPMPPHASVRAALLAEKERTGAGPATLLRDDGQIPPGLNARLIHSWLGDAVATARRVHLEFVLRRWRALPSVERVAVTPRLRRALRDHKARTAVGPIKLLTLSADVPEGLSPGTIDNWIDGLSKSAIKEQLEFALAAYAALPTAAPRIEVTETILRELRAHVRRTDLGPQALLRGRRDKPQGLRLSTIDGWLSGKSKHANPDHLDYVFRLWREADPFVPITADVRRTLIRERQRTGMATHTLVRAAGAPAGISAGMVDRWLAGRARKARRSHLDFVLERWRAVPDGAGRERISRGRSCGPRPRHSIIGSPPSAPLSPEVVAELQRESARTGTGAHLLLKSCPAAPADLKAGTVRRWLTGEVRTARPDHLEFVLKAWRALPDGFGLPRPRR